MSLKIPSSSVSSFFVMLAARVRNISVELNRASRSAFACGNAWNIIILFEIYVLYPAILKSNNSSNSLNNETIKRGCILCTRPFFFVRPQLSHPHSFSSLWTLLLSCPFQPRLPSMYGVETPTNYYSQINKSQKMKITELGWNEPQKWNYNWRVFFLQFLNEFSSTNDINSS